MLVSMSARSTLPATDALHASFLALLPQIESYARRAFAAVRCPDTRAEKIQEMLALAWKWFVRLHEVGKDLQAFVAAFITFAAKAVKSGRRLTGMEPPKDVLSPRAQRQHGFTVTALPASTRAAHATLYGQPHGQDARDAFEERLQDNRQTPIPEQVAFRLDWPRYVQSLSDRDRRLAAFLALGHSAQQAATAFGVSPTRVTQLRQHWCRAWHQFQEAEPVEV